MSVRNLVSMGPARVGLLALVCLAPGAAHASGLNGYEKGVRGLGRGGAFVAGGDDLGAINYNPAGIFGAGSQVFVDGTFAIFDGNYTRQSLLRQVDPNTGETVGTFEQTFETVDGSAIPLPIPTLAGSFMPHPDWVVAVGVSAPAALLTSYPTEDAKGQPAPQRYQLYSLDGSLLLNIGGYVAWRPVDELTIGLGLEVLVGSFNSRQALSGCLPDRFFCAPEDPEWDLVAEIGAAPIITPSGSVGAIWEFYDGWKLGASFHLPYWIIAPASLESRLPSAAPYRLAEQEGKDATLEFQLPWELRVGIEARPVKGLAIEVAADYEHWAMHDKITVEPDNIAVTNLPGFPEKYYLPEITIPRNFQSTIQGMIGAEYEIEATRSVSVTPRLGFSYETSATPVEYTSVLTLDSGKATVSGGASVSVGDARFDLVYAHQFIQTVTVSPETARLPQTVPVSANPPEEPNYINGGVYDWRMDIVGVGFAYTFDHPKKRAVEDEDAAPPPPAAKPAPKEPDAEEE